MKVTGIETLACDAGWRNYHFVKLTTDSGIVGWSEFDEGFGSPGVGTVIERLDAARRRPAGRRARAHLCRALLRHAARRRRRRRPGAWAPSRTRCSMPRPRRWACRATSCWAARCATASGSTGRIAPPGASITRPTTSPPSPTSTASRPWAARCARRGFTALKTNIFIYEQGGKNPKGWRPGFGAPFYPELNVDRDRAAQPAHAPGGDARRRRARRRHAARPQLQRQDRGLSQDPARDRRPRHVLDRDRHASAPRRWATSAARARTRSPRARRCSACASSCPTSASRRWTSPSSTRPGTACGSR